MGYHIEEEIKSLQLAQTLSELLSIVERNTAALGFEFFSFGHRSHTPVSAPKLELINNYPSTWQDTYTDKQYFKKDPTILHAMKSTQALIWTEDTFLKSKNLREDAASHGINFGWSQATRSTSGLSMLTLARPYHAIAGSEITENFANLLWFTQAANSAFEGLINNVSSAVDVLLTNRETEVLRWTADGKTSYEISVILSISERTVNFHLNNSMIKLNSNNKISATVKALSLSLI